VRVGEAENVGRQSGKSSIPRQVAGLRRHVGTPDRRPSAEPSRQVVLGRHSTEARRGVVSQPVTATRANRWMTSRARRRATSAPYRYRGCLRSCSAREELRSSLREQVSHLCLPSGTGGCGSSPPRRPCAGSNMAEAQKRNAAVELVSSGPEARRELPRTTLQASKSRRRSRPASCSAAK